MELLNLESIESEIQLNKNLQSKASVESRLCENI